MFSRSATRLTAWAALIAVVFVVLLPATLNAAGKSSTAIALHGLSVICTVDGANTLPPAPDQQRAATLHKPCLFCTSGAPIFADANAPRVVAMIEGIPVVVGAAPAEMLPPDVAATQPLNPRAPPRPH
jgi:hypothetical protein